MVVAPRVLGRVAGPYCSAHLWGGGEVVWGVGGPDAALVVRSVVGHAGLVGIYPHYWIMVGLWGGEEGGVLNGVWGDSVCESIFSAA